MAGFGPADDPGYASLVSPIVVSQLPQTDVVDLLCDGGESLVLGDLSINQKWASLRKSWWVGLLNTDSGCSRTLALTRSILG
jgi:hypothetical protein